MGLQGMLGYWGRVFSRALSKSLAWPRRNWPDELLPRTMTFLKGQLARAAKANA